jgi:hypothetical protein
MNKIVIDNRGLRNLRKKWIKGSLSVKILFNIGILYNYE